MLKEDKNIIQVLFYTIVIGMFVLWCLNIISANGLTIVNTNNFSINKTVGTNEIIVFQIGNDKPFSFYNVTISSPYIKMTTIPEIASGALYNVTGIIFTDSTSVKEFVVNFTLINFSLKEEVLKYPKAILEESETQYIFPTICSSIGSNNLPDASL